MIRPVTLAVILALVGCQSADVQRAQPTLTIPAAWRADVGPASPVEGVWWRNFHDSTLNQYVDRALRYNSDVLIARERVNEYQARAYAADSSLFPSLDASLSGTRARAQSAATGLPIHSTLYKGGLTASYDVDIWGANRSAASAAGASLEAQKAAAAAANLSVASSVAVGYVTLLSLDEQLRVTQQTLKSREDAWRRRCHPGLVAGAAAAVYQPHRHRQPAGSYTAGAAGQPAATVERRRQYSGAAA